MSKKEDEKGPERQQWLMMKAVDGELTAAEASEFAALRRSDPNIEHEWRQLSELSEVTKMMKFKQPPQEVWDRYWLGVYNRLERGLAWILFSLGSIVLLTYGLYHVVDELFADLSSQPLIKGAVLLVLLGLVMLLVSVIREKVTLYRSDPYKEVQR